MARRRSAPATYRAAYVEATGELYVMQHEGTPGGGRVDVIGHFDDFAEVERRLSGWEDVCGEPGSIDWMLHRMSPRTARPRIASRSDADVA